MIDAGIETELIDDVSAFLIATGNTYRSGPVDLGNLANNRSDSP